MKYLILIANVIPSLLCAQIMDSAFVFRMVQEGFKNCELIIQGESIEHHSYWNTDSTYIYTSYKIRIDSILKNVGKSIEDKYLEGITEGGTVELYSLEITHQTTFSHGTKFLVLLDKITDTNFLKTGDSGKVFFRIHDGVLFNLHDNSEKTWVYFSGNKFDLNYLYHLISE